MNQYWWAAILFAILIGWRVFQWLALRGEGVSEAICAPVAPAASDAGRQQVWEPQNRAGATGIVPSGVSWTAPGMVETPRARIELGKKRFRKGRNG